MPIWNADKIKLLRIQMFDLFAVKTDVPIKDLCRFLQVVKQGAKVKFYMTMRQKYYAQKKKITY